MDTSAELPAKTEFSPEQLAQATLDFINQTDKFCRDLGYWGMFDPDPIVKVDEEAMSYEDVLEQSIGTVNDSLMQVGGIAIELTNAEDGSKNTYYFNSWLGYDPDEPDNFVLGIKDSQGDVVISIARSEFQELRIETPRENLHP